MTLVFIGIGILVWQKKEHADRDVLHTKTEKLGHTLGCGKTKCFVELEDGSTVKWEIAKMKLLNEEPKKNDY